MQPTLIAIRRSMAPIAVFLLVLLGNSSAQSSQSSLELSRPVRSWEFLPVVGTRAALFGNEAGPLEAWVYPLKLFRNFHLNFLVGGQTVPAESLARTVIVRPESSTIVYSGDTFSVRETLFVPVHEPGALINFEIHTAQPLEIEAVFERDFQLEWPAALGGTFLNWDAGLHAFALGEERKKYAALIGSPTAAEPRQEYFSNYSFSRDSVFRLGVTNSGRDNKLIVIAASSQGFSDAENTYHRLGAGYPELLLQSADYYRNYLARTVSLELPDPQLQQAYDWSRISMVQGVVTNPNLGTGLIAGYRSSGDGQRPGFAWYFGRDSLWTSLALNAEGDFPTARLALEFLSKYQRPDGKVEHEISQAVGLVPWFTDYPYAYASADATPLFIIAADDYATHSGDLDFIKEKWDSLWKAYQFLRSTYDSRGFPQNSGVGHGWVEGGPLLPVRAELYQVSLGTAALRSLSHMAEMAGKDQVHDELNREFFKQQLLLNQMFWSEEKGLFAFAVGADYGRIDIPSVLATVPMWFDLLDEDKAERMLTLLAGPEHQTDWGMRIISSQEPKYSPGGYHFGSVWPLFTGWASVAEYRDHRVFPAYENLRANALLALNGSLGHVTEVLSGDFFEPLSTSSPHQIWSAAMVVSPVLRGMMGMEVNARTRAITFRPHVPADWTFFRIRGVRVGDASLDFTYRKTADGISLAVQRGGTVDCAVDFAPALSLRAKVLQAEVNGQPVPAPSAQNSEDQHVTVHFSVNRPTVTVQIRTSGDFGLALDSALPPLGNASQGLRVISESWDKDRGLLTLEVEGVSGNEYSFAIWNQPQIASVEGAEMHKDDLGQPKLRLSFPPGPPGYQSRQIKLKFVPK